MKNLALRWGLVLSLLLTLVTVSAGAAGEIPNAPARPDHTSHDGWTPWSSTSDITGSGSYYLADDADFTQMTEQLDVGAGGTTINLCLNGHTLKWAADKVAQGQYTLSIRGGTVNICDCSETPGGLVCGRKAGTNSETDAGVNAYALGIPGGTTCNWFDASISNSFGRYGVVYLGTNNSGKAATFNFVSGTISNNDVFSNGVIQVNQTATVNMWADAKLMNNNKYSAVVLDGTGSVFNMYGGTISGNTASNYGGAVHIKNGNTFNMYDGTISGNSAVDYGGAVYVTKGTVNMSGGTISGNKTTATANTGVGGAFRVEAGTFNMSGGTIGGTTAADANIGRHAGGVYLAKGVTFNMSGDAAITGNTCQFYGGGLYNCGGTATMSGNATISNNTATSPYTDNGYGAGVCVNSSGTLTMNDNAAITGNTASGSRGAGLLLHGGTVTMNGSSAISNNTSPKEEGGGVYVKAGTFTMNGGTISGNSATTGGAALIEGTFNLKDGSITGNKGTASSHTGGVYVLNPGVFNMSGGTISNNSGTYEAEAVYVKGGTFNMENGTISGKTGASDTNRIDHNGVHLTASGATLPTFNMSGGTIKDFHISGPNGGAVRISNGTFTMKGGVIENCTKTSNSAGVYLGAANSEFVMAGDAIIRNCTSTGNGAGVCASAGKFTMNGGTITGNSAATGGGVYTDGATVEINGGSIYGNTISGWCGHDVAVFQNGTVTVNGGTIGQNKKGASIGLHAGKATTGVYTPTFTMNGGFFDGGFTYSVVSGAQGTGAAVNINLNGGTYVYKYTAGSPAKDCHMNIAEGKEFKSYDGKYLVATSFEQQNNMNLGKTLDMYIRIPVAGTEAVKAYATIEGKDTVEADFEIEDGNYVITLPGVAAAEMTKTITVVLKDAKGNTINVATDSIREYGLRVLADESMSDAHAVVADMLRYGAAAQKYFSEDEIAPAKLADYGVNELTNKGADGAEILALSKAEIANISFAHSRAYSYANLTLDDKVDFNLYFWVDQIGEEDKSYTYSINDGAAVSGTFSQYLDADNEVGEPVLYALKVEGLAVADLANAKVTVNFFEKGQAKTITDSVYNYLARTDNMSKWSEDGQDDSGLAQALMAFATSGNEFAGAAVPGENETTIG